MTDALVHRGPDENGWFFAKGIGIGHQRLQIVGLADGRQPIFNEDRTVSVIYNGELFDYPEQRALLAAKGHVFRTHTDTEIIPHLYEEYGEGMFEHLKGQFAFALVDLNFRAPFAASIFNNPPGYVRDLMSTSALRKTGYFDVEKVRYIYEIFEKGLEGKPGFATQVGLVGVLATQLWHRIHIDGNHVEPAEAVQQAELARPAVSRPLISAALARGGIS